jgi:hypothetical protein
MWMAPQQQSRGTVYKHPTALKVCWGRGNRHLLWCAPFWHRITVPSYTLGDESRHTVITAAWMLHTTGKSAAQHRGVVHTTGGHCYMYGAVGHTCRFTQAAWRPPTTAPVCCCSLQCAVVKRSSGDAATDCI